MSQSNNDPTERDKRYESLSVPISSMSLELQESVQGSASGIRS
jgi:hypothetical protein